MSQPSVNNLFAKLTTFVESATANRAEQDILVAVMIGYCNGHVQNMTEDEENAVSAIADAVSEAMTRNSRPPDRKLAPLGSDGPAEPRRRLQRWLS